MKFSTLTAAQKAAAQPYTGDQMFFWFWTSAAQPFYGCILWIRLGDPNLTLWPQYLFFFFLNIYINRESQW